MKRVLLLVTLLTIVKILNAQQSDSLRLSVVDFIQKVKTYHPIAKAAALQVPKANAELLMAKGAFDPTLEFVADRKTFDGKNYYFYNTSSIKVPLPIGDVKTGIENNGGELKNPEFTSGRSSFAGVEIPVAKGLLLDKRRAALQQARIAVNAGAVEQRMMVNDVLLDAITAYYEWAAADALVEIFNDYAQVSYQRLQGIKTLFVNGDKPQMDTLEAFAQYQSFEQLKLDALVKRTSATYELDNYLWDTNSQPQGLLPQIKPQDNWMEITLNWQTLEALQTTARQQNPFLQQYDFKLRSLEIERRLKFQELLPTVNLKANLLNRGYNILENPNAAFFQNNYKWGLEVKIPLFFREGRGAYKMAKLKIQETDFFFQQKILTVQNKLADYYNQANQYLAQQNIINGNVNNYRQLLRSENLRFANGESSVFVINARESKLIEALQKSIEINVKMRKAYYNIYWLIGNTEEGVQ